MLASSAAKKHSVIVADNPSVSQEHPQQKPAIQARKKLMGSCKRMQCQCLLGVKAVLLLLSQMWVCCLHKIRAS